MHYLFGFAAWLVAGFFSVRALDTARNVDRVQNLRLEPVLDAQSLANLPSLTVIVPARNESGNIAATLASLLASDYPRFNVVAINDRSSDATGEMMESFSRHDDRLAVIHVTELPPGWMGKPHAMHLGVRQERASWLLFTDGDVLFSPDVLSRAVAYAERCAADHLVVLPTWIMKGIGERSMLGFLQTTMGMMTRLWRVSDPHSKRDVVGIGAFNMIRRSVYEQIGGFAGSPMEVLEDLRLGKRVKQAGFAQRVAFAPGMVRVRWAVGGVGIARNMTKNLFALVTFRWWVAGAACAWLVLVYPGAFVGLIAGIVGWRFLLAPCALIELALIVTAQKYKRMYGVSAWYVITYPVAAVVVAAALVSSVVLTWVRGGVLWRGTLYPLSELRKHATPLF